MPRTIRTRIRPQNPARQSRHAATPQSPSGMAPPGTIPSPQSPCASPLTRDKPGSCSFPQPPQSEYHLESRKTLFSPQSTCPATEIRVICDKNSANDRRFPLPPWIFDVTESVYLINLTTPTKDSTCKRRMCTATSLHRMLVWPATHPDSSPWWCTVRSDVRISRKLPTNLQGASYCTRQPGSFQARSPGRRCT